MTRLNIFENAAVSLACAAVSYRPGAGGVHGGVITVRDPGAPGAALVIKQSIINIC